MRHGPPHKNIPHENSFTSTQKLFPHKNSFTSKIFCVGLLMRSLPCMLVQQTDKKQKRTCPFETRMLHRDQDVFPALFVRELGLYTRTHIRAHASANIKTTPQAALKYTHQKSWNTARVPIQGHVLNTSIQGRVEAHVSVHMRQPFFYCFARLRHVWR